MSGRALQQAGYTNVVGIDASNEMLSQAKERGYKELKEVFLCKDQFPEEYLGKFDIAISVGVLGHGLSPDVFFEMISCLRPKESEDDNKRYIIFTAREGCMEKHKYNEKLQELENEGTLKLQERFSFERSKNLKNQGEMGFMKHLFACCCVYTI